MADKRELLFILKGKDQGAKKAFDDLGDSADEARDDVDDMRTGLRALDGQLGKSRAQVEGLRKEIARSGDLGLVKDLEKADRELKKLTKQRKLLIGEDDGDEAGRSFWAGFIARVGPLAAQAPLSPQIAGAIAASGGVISSAVAGAVTTGVALASVGIGLKVAFKDPQVKAAGKELGDQLNRQLSTAFAPFTRSTVEGIGLLRKELQAMQPDLDRIGAASAKFVPQLAGAGGRGLRDFADGVADAVENSDPLIDVLEYRIPRAAGEAGDALRTLSADSQFNADTMSAAFAGVELAIGGTAGAISFAADNFKYSFAGALVDATNGLQDSETVLKRIPPEIADVNEEMGLFVGTTRLANGELAGFNDAIDQLTGEAFEAEEANIRLQGAIDAATAAGKANNDGISANTEKGRENRKLLLDLASAANSNAQAIYNQTSSMEAANAATQAAKTQFIAAATAMGVERQEAINLANQLFGLPKAVGGTINYNDKPARDAIRRVVEAGGKVKDIHRGIYYTVKGDLKVPGGTLTKAEGGYIDAPGPKGRDSVPAILAPGEFVLRSSVVDKLGKDTLHALNRGDMNAWARQVGNTMPPAAPRRVMAAGHGGARRGSAPFGWAGMQRSFISFLVDSIDAAGGDSDVLRIGRGKAA